MCSEKCPCKINADSSFDKGGMITGGTAVNIMDCNRNEIAKAMNRAIVASGQNIIGFISNNIYLEDMVNYLGAVEIRNKCTGICDKAYPYSKYIFSDINRNNDFIKNNLCLSYIDQYNPSYSSSFTRYSLISNICFILHILFMSILVYIDLNNQYKERVDKENAMNNPTETQCSADIFNYEKPEEAKDNNNNENEEEDSSSESDDIEFDTEDEEDSNNKISKELELTDVIN